MQVCFHELGSDPRGRARLALGTKDGLERVSEVFLDSHERRNGILASVQRGDGGEFAFYLLRPEKPAEQIATYEDHIVYATIGPDDADLRHFA